MTTRQRVTPPSPATKPTLADVARIAGVTPGTASKALNGKGKLRDETRERVRVAGRALGFQPNDLARSLTRGRTFTVGLLTGESYSRFSIPLLVGVEDTLGGEAVSVFLCDARGDPVRERHYVESLMSKRVDGIIVLGGRTDRRRPLQVEGPAVPIIYAYTYTDRAGDLCVLPDDEHGGRLATEHLLGSGRQRLAHIGGPEQFEAALLRRQGMEAALAAHGLELPRGRLMPGPWSEAWGYEAVNRLLDRDPGIDGIFCASDQLGRGAADALRERGVAVPADVALVGFDNWEVISAATRPPLTTVDMDLHEIGRVAGRRLLSIVEGAADAGAIRLPCRLVVRESCGTGRDRTPGGYSEAYMDAAYPG